LKTVKGARSKNSWAETVGEIISKGMNFVANDWVKNRFLKIFLQYPWGLMYSLFHHKPE